MELVKSIDILQNSHLIYIFPSIFIFLSHKTKPQGRDHLFASYPAPRVSTQSLLREKWIYHKLMRNNWWEALNR